MDFRKVPIGFAMELAQNDAAMAKYTAMSDERKQAVLAKAHIVHSRQEMRNLVSDIGKGLK